MAQAEEARARPREKKGLSAVYVNRFGKHLSGTVIKFGGKGATEEEKTLPVLRQQTAVTSLGENKCRTAGGAKPGLDAGLKGRSDMKRAAFLPPIHLKSPELSPEQVDSGTLMQNNENADVFKFPLPANNDAAKGKKRRQLGKKREAFRVICKMLHENEILRTRLLTTSQKSTVVADEQTISEREKDSPKALDASPFGWV
uniref:uncharacterized protein C5orf47-like n=1 Tax=Pristiophorus japonicus TaxID=55135 RepID=UPI00398E7D6E